MEPKKIKWAPLLSWIRAAMLYGGSKALYRGISIILAPVILAYLTIEEYGNYGLLLTIVALLPAITSLGLHGAIGRFYFNATDETSREKTMTTLFTAHITVVLGLTFLLDLIVGGSVNGILGIPYHPLFRITLWAAALSALLEGPAAYWRSAQKPTRVASAYAIAGFLLAVGSIFFLIRGYGLVGILWAQLLGPGIVAISCIGLVFLENGCQYESSVLKRAFLYSLPSVPHLVVAWFLRMADRWFLATYAGTEAVGSYFLLFQIAGAMHLLLVGLNEAATALFLEAYSNEGADGAIRIHSWVFPKLVLVTVVLSGLMLLISPLLVPLLSHGEIQSDNTTLLFLLAGLGALALYTPYANASFARKETARLLLMNVAGAVITLVANIILVPIWAGRGAAAAMCLGQVTILILVAFSAHRRLGLRIFGTHLIGGAAAIAIIALLSALIY